MQSGDMSCESGYEGALCGVCEDGYTYEASTETCQPCSVESTFLDPFTIIMICLIIVGMIAAYKWMKRLNKDMNIEDLDDLIIAMMYRFNFVDKTILTNPTLMVHLKEAVYQNRNRLLATCRIYITFYQILSNLPFILAVEFPSLLVHFAAVVDFVNVGISGSSFVACSDDKPLDAVDILYFNCAYPIAGIIIIQSISLLHAYLKFGWRGRSAQQKLAVIQLKANYSSATLLWMYLLLPSVSYSLFAMLR